MTLDEIIKTTLEPVTGLDGHVYPVEALKNAAPPFAFYLQTAEDEEDTLDGRTGLLEATFEVHIVAKTYANLICWPGPQNLPCRSCRALPMETCSSSGTVSGKLPRT